VESESFLLSTRVELSRGLEFEWAAGFLS
jgi:hypothetical protein